MNIFNNIKGLGWTPGSLEIPDLYNMGSFESLFTPRSQFCGDKTWIIGSKDQDTNHQTVILEYDGEKNSIEQAIVGNGSDNFDAFNHQQPAVIFNERDRYIYVIQCNTHNEKIDLFKSNAQETILNGFTRIAQIQPSGFGYAYPNVFFSEDHQRMFILTRSDDPPKRFSLCLLYSDLNDFTLWNHKQLTLSDFNNDSSRHYPHELPRFGNCSKYVFIGNFRYDPTVTYRAQFLLETDDFNTFYNYNRTSSRTITNIGNDTSQALSQDDLVNLGFYVNGDVNSDNHAPTYARGCVVHDIVYLTVKKNGSTQGEIVRIENGNISRFDIPAPNFIQDSSFSKAQIIGNHNSDGLIVLLIMNNETDIWTCDLNGQNWTLKERIPLSGGWGMPQNYEKVKGTFLMAGGNELGVSNFIRTSVKF